MSRCVGRHVTSQVLHNAKVIRKEYDYEVFFKVSALVIAATMMSTMTAAFADNVVEESNSEAFAQSFIKNYYSSMYLDEEFDDSNIEFDELREYIRTKINYMQFVTSDVENFDIQMELISKDESTDAIYLAYFVEAEYNYVD